MRIGCYLVVVAVVGIAPVAWGQSIKNVVVSGPVYSGNAFTVTVEAAGSSDTQLKFDLSGCDGCTLSPAAGTVFNFVGLSQNYTLTINTSSARNGVLLTVFYGTGFGKDISSNPFNVQLATPTKLKVEAPATANAGTPFTVTITALGDSDRLAYGFNNSVTVTSNDPSKPSLGAVTLNNGTGSLAPTLPTAQITGITAAFAGLASGTDTIQITAVAPTRFEIVVTPAEVNAGDSFSVTINAKDTSGNLVTGYSGTVTLTTTDPRVPSLSQVDVGNGTGTLTTAVLQTAGAHTISAAAGSVNGSGAVSVRPGQASVLTVAASPSLVAAGSSFSVQITAKDVFGNIVTAYGPTITLRSTDGTASGMGNVTLTSGTGSFLTTHQQAGTHTITATGLGAPSISGQAQVTVTAAAATHFDVVSANPTATAGVAFNFTVTARDQFGNKAPTYPGTVHFTSADGQAVLPANTQLSGGMATFQATLKTAGSQTIKATDTVNASTTGTSNNITVTAGALTSYVIGATGSIASGTSFPVSVTAKDAFFNTVESYNGTANITHNDTQPVIPSSVTFRNGEASFSATLKAAGTRTITVTDQAITASKLIEVQATAATTIEISGLPPSVTAGEPFAFTVTARDQAGNISSDYNGTL